MDIIWYGANLTVFILFLIYAYYKWCFNYWKRRNVPEVNQPTIPLGNFNNHFSKNSQSIFTKLKNDHIALKKMGVRHGGLYSGSNPIYQPIDPVIIKNIVSKDFDHFMNKGIYYNTKNDRLSANLFTFDGDRWTKLRSKITPTFTSGKIKAMLPTLLACADQLKEFIDGLVERGVSFDIRETIACFTINVIGSCAFGLDCNCFENPNSEFRTNARLYAKYDTALKVLKVMLVNLFPRLAQLLSIKVTNKKMEKFFMSIVRETVNYRETNNVSRNDYLQLLIALKNKDNGLTIDEVTAEAFTFYVGGFESSTTTTTFCLFELAQNMEIQDRVRDEIYEVLARYDGELTYECISEMKYLDQVIDETLRMHPVGGVIVRQCSKNYKVPDIDLVIEKGTKVVISTTALQCDPEYFPEPEKFDPDRFSDENKSKIVPYTYLPFGEGPRNCIGKRFGMLQVKLGLLTIIKNYRVTLNEKTKLPIQLNPNSFFGSTLETIMLDFEMFK